MSGDDGLRVVRLEASNFMRLQAVALEPDGTIVEVAGKNGQGKSSLLNAVFAAMAGAAGVKDIPRPIRDGEDHAEVSVDLGELRVRRQWTEKGTTLRVENADGSRLTRPQEILDTLLGKLSFDPLAFSEQPAKAQVETLLSVIDLPFDPEELARLRADLYDQRTIIGRDVRRLEGALAESTAPADAPEAEIDVAALLAEVRDVQDEVRQNQALRDEIAASRAALDRRLADLEALREQVTRMESECASASEALVQLEALAIPEDEDPDPAPLEKRLTEAQDLNRAFHAAAERRRQEEDLRLRRAEYEGLTLQIEVLDESKASAVAEADMPVEGLDFDQEGVTYHGVPFVQCSAAERLRVSLAIAMALNPSIRVIRVTDASLLDGDSRAIVEDMARDKGYQVWLEVVGDGGEAAVVIEDGLVREKP